MAQALTRPAHYRDRRHRRAEQLSRGRSQPVQNPCLGLVRQAEVQAALASQHKINTSSRAGGIRVSLHACNSSDDIRALAQALAA